MRFEVGIIALLEQALEITVEKRAQFEWLRNKPSREYFGDSYQKIMDLYEEFNGDWQRTVEKADGYLTPDAYLPEPYNFIFEFDELQHFTKYRALTFKYYSEEIPLAYETEEYVSFCNEYHVAALAKGPDRFRRRTADFPYKNGRAAQRAFFDTFRDWLPSLNGLNPTVRVSEFEVKPILSGELTDDDAISYMKKLIGHRIANII